MGMRRRILSAAVLLSACSSFALAQETAPKARPADDGAPAKAASPGELKVGSKAPALSIEKWMRGDAITGFEKGRVYMVEFWATWCGPCIKSMPHLSALQKQYKDKGVTIVGVSTRDNNGNTKEKAEQMVAEKQATMAYTVAWDKGQETYESYMKAAKQRGIPTCFVVDGNGDVQYIGHPMWVDGPLEKITKGTWNAATGMKEMREAEARFSAAVSKAMASGDEAALKELTEIGQTYPGAAAEVDSLRYVVLTKNGSPEASALGRKLADAAVEQKDAARLNELAWGIVDPEAHIAKKDLDFALFAASKAADLSGNKDGAILDTLARVHFCKGEIDKAIEIQKKALEVAPEGLKDDLQSSLDEYVKAKK